MAAHPCYEALTAGAARELAVARPAQAGILEQLELMMDAEGSGCRTPDEWAVYFRSKCPTLESLEAEVEKWERILGDGSLVLKNRSKEEDRLRMAKQELAARRSNSWLLTVSLHRPLSVVCLKSCACAEQRLAQACCRAGAECHPRTPCARQSATRPRPGKR